MLSEQSDAPLRRPWANAPSGSSTVGWVAGFSAAALEPGGELYSLFTTAIARITPTIYNAFLPPRSGTNARSGGFRWHVDRGAELAYSQFGRDSAGWGGLYRTGSNFSALSVSNGSAIAVLDNMPYAASTFIHEFGHHVDYAHTDLWPGSTWVKGQRLTSSTSNSPFNALWTAARPDIPTPLYGSTNEREWFAELFTCQLFPNYRGGDSATLFLQLCGSNTTRARAVRAAFKAALPMPGTFAYD